MPEISFDSSVLSNFALADAMPILERMYGGFSYCTGFVAAEIMRGVGGKYPGLERVAAAIQAGWLIEVNLESSTEKSLLASLSQSLDLGEASALSAAINRGWTFACDDLAARREAQARGIELTGTIGILVKAVKSGILALERADEILALMIKRGFYAPVKSMKSLVD
jgi:predicted nucleic acid-binding protein